MLLQMPGEQISPCQRPFVTLAQAVDISWIMLFPLVAVETLPLGEADPANTAPELLEKVVLWSNLALWTGDVTTT